MKSSTITTPSEFTESQRNALLTLLTDEDIEVYSRIRNTIVASGPAAVDWLRPHTLSHDPVLRRRAQSIVRQFEGHAADNEFVAFCLSTGEDLPLEKGVLLLARTTYPEINISGYNALLDQMAAELRLRLENITDPRQALRAMRLFLLNELRFRGNEENYYDPENSYFNRVMDRRLGNPISLCTIYILLARRLQLPITGIGLPGHFICRYQSSSTEVYIDVFRGGKLLNKADCVRYLHEGHFGFQDDYLAPVSSRRMLLRMCGNLHQVYAQTQQSEEATRLRRYMVALSR
jgi:regulator of sirC expression with transglutaminase-like and TPR domain